VTAGPRLVVARVARAHGLHGEVTVRMIGDDPDRLTPGRELWLEKPGVPERVLRVGSRRGAPGRLLVCFDGVTTREQAQALTGGDLSVEFDAADAREGEFYAHQLQGLSVRTVTGASVGRVAGVAFLPGRDFLEVEQEGRPGTRLIPFHGDIVKSVDLARGQVTIDPPEGLLEL
jgi:16S rRNA processing protein RimM